MSPSALAFAVATANLNQRFGPTILLYLIVGAVVHPRIYHGSGGCF